MDNERLKLYLDFGKFFLGTFLIGIITFAVKSGFESREIAIKESEQIGKYVEIALREDIGTRKRFAEYFKTVTISDRYRTRWTNYYELVKKEFDTIKATVTLIDKEKDSLMRLVATMESDKDSIREDLYYKIDELEKEQAMLASELEVKPEETIPETYQIVLHSVHPDASVKEKIRAYMNEQLFNLSRDSDYETRQSWMSEQSTVIYYNPISRYAAKAIASDLQKLTGVKFAVQRSRVPNSRRRQDYNFVIHYIN